VYTEGDLRDFERVIETDPVFLETGAASVDTYVTLLNQWVNDGGGLRTDFVKQFDPSFWLSDDAIDNPSLPEFVRKEMAEDDSLKVY